MKLQKLNKKKGDKMTIFFEWLRRRHPRYLMEQDAPVPAPVPAPTEDNDTYEAAQKEFEELQKSIAEKRAKAKDRAFAWGDTLGYTKEEILFNKPVIPKEMIRNSQFDPSKWDQDYEKLKQQSPWKGNFATDKSLFDEPVRMLVVTNAGFTRQGGTEAYQVMTANSSKTVVLPDYNFEVLPKQESPTWDGKLTQEGKNMLSRILRYTTQSKGHVDTDRNFDPKYAKPGYRSISTYPNQNNPNYDSNRYYKDPKEMGVRLAAIKNYMSKDSLRKIANLSLGNLSVSNKLVEALPNDEKHILWYVLNHDQWGSGFAGINSLNKNDANNAHNAVNELIDNLKKKNRDIDEMLNFYKTLGEEDKSKFLKELTDNYDTVVQNKPQYSQNRMT
jgi:hypothetical protein